MIETAFESLLDDGILVRVRFGRERGRVLSFVVQLERLIENEWQPVIRYDTAHGFAHCDLLWPDGTQDKHPMPTTDFNEALTFAQQDIRANYRRYCGRFEEARHERRNC